MLAGVRRREKVCLDENVGGGGDEEGAVLLVWQDVGGVTRVEGAL